MTTGAAFIWGRSWIRDEIIVGHLLTHQAGIAKMATCTRIVNPTMVHVPWICRRLGGTVTVVAPKARRCSQAAGIGWCNQTLGKGAVMDHVKNLSTPTRTGDRRGCVPHAVILCKQQTGYCQRTGDSHHCNGQHENPSAQTLETPRKSLIVLRTLHHSPPSTTVIVFTWL